MGKKAKQSTDALVQSTEDQAAAITEVGDASENAAKQAKKNLQTFDEVHQLQEDMSDTAAWDMFTMSETGTIAPPEIEDAEESGAFTKMQETLEKLAVLFDPAIEGFNRLKTAAEPVITSIGKGLKWFYDNILVPFGTWVISEAVPSFMNLLSGALDALNPILKAFKPLGQWLWENFLQPAGEWAGETLLNALNWLADVLTKIGNWMSEHKGVIEALAIVVGSFAAAWGLVNIAIGVWNTIGAIATGVTTAFGAAVAFVTSPIFLVVAAIAAVIAITVLLVKNWDTVKEWLKETWNKIKDIAVSVWNSIKEFFSKLWEWLKNFFSEWGPIILAIIAPFIGIPLLIFQNWDKIKDFFSNLWKKISNQLSEAWQKIKDTAKKFWDDLVKSAFDWGKNLINNIIDGIKSTVNKVKDAVSNVASKIKGFLGFSSPTEEGPGRDADKWAPNFVDMYRKGIRQGIPSISSSLTEIAEEMAGLATMTVQPAVQATASVGYTADSGRMSDGIAQAVYRAIIDAFRITQASSGQSGNDDREIVLKIDNTVLARLQLPALIREGQRQGLNLVVQPQGV
jgi:phage-related protein